MANTTIYPYGDNGFLSPDPKIVNDLTTGGTEKVLSAEQGKVLNQIKQDVLVSGTNIKTINNESLLGSGNITISGGTGGEANVIEAVTFNGTPATITNKTAAITAAIPTDSNLVHITGVEHISGGKAFAEDVTLEGNNNILANTVRSGFGWIEDADGYNIQEKLDEKYVKPSGGIPVTDLNSAIQTSLSKADTALQSYTETDPIFNASAAAGITTSDITNWNNKTSNTGTVTGVKINGTTNNPTSGIVDLGTVLTSYTETDPTVPAWAKAANKPTYTATEVGALPSTTSIPTESTVAGWGFTKNTGTLTSETDPIFTASAAYGISSTDISNWNAKQKAITVSSSEPTSSDGNNGDIWIVI